ncbi:MAG: TOBE domain-containing protein [Actinomycetes bacterium]
MELEIGGGNRIRATITRESTRTLRLQAGAPVTAGSGRSESGSAGSPGPPRCGG